MSGTVEYALYNSDTDSEYVLPTARLNGSGAIGYVLQKRIMRTPSIVDGFVVGDLTANTTQIALTFFVAAANAVEAAEVIDTTVVQAEAATSLLRRTQSDRNVGEVLTAWRAVNALVGLRARQNEGESRYFTVSLRFLPKFGRATVNRAETSSAYSAATKTIAGGVWGG